MDAEMIKMMDAKLEGFEKLFNKQIEGFEKLFNKQNELVSNQIITINKSGDKISIKVGLISEKLEVLIKAEGSHYSNCPHNEKFEATAKEINKLLDEMDDRIKVISFILPFKKLLYTLKFIIEWKIVFIPVLVVVLCLSAVGGIQGYEAGKKYIMEWVATKEQVDKNTKFIHQEEQKEIKDILKNEAN